MPLTTGGALVKRGDTYDYECSRTTSRLRGARAVLAALGAEPTVAHAATTTWDWATNRDVHACDYRCETTWPGWVTDEMFGAAYDLACRTTSARGSYARRQPVAALS